VKNVVTISRQMGSGGRSAADFLSDRLGLPVVGKEMVTEAAAKKGIDPGKIERIFEHRITLQDRLTVQQKSAKYLAAIKDTIQEYAEKGDVILLGRGAHIILSDHPNVFRVYLNAELDVRIARIAQKNNLKGKKGLESARQTVVESDYARASYHNYLFGVDSFDPLLYDLGLNTTWMAVKQTGDAILSVFELVRG
jgi:cytidylate kinase